MAKKGRKFRITKTKDEDKEEILVEDMEEEKEEVIDMEGETMDAAEYKEVSDMCKDMGFENIKDAIAELKELKGAQDEEETEEEKKKREAKEAKEAKDKKGAKDEAIPTVKSLEQDIASLEDPERKAAAIASFAKTKDALNGFIVVKDKDVTKLVLDTKREEDEEDYEETPEFVSYGNVVRDMYNPHTKKE